MVCGSLGNTTTDEMDASGQNINPVSNVIDFILCGLQD